MVGLLFASLAQEAPRTIQETPAWKRYQAELAKAQMIEVEWDVWEDQKQKDKFVLRVRDGKQVSLEQVGRSITVWNGKSGVLVDHAKKEYTLLKEKPDFAAAAFLEIHGALTTKGNVATFGLRTNTITAGNQMLSLISVTSHMIDAAAIYTYGLDQLSKTLSWLCIQYRGMWEGGEKRVDNYVKRFDLYAMFDGATFSVRPPLGYVEKVPPDVALAGSMVE